MKISQLREYAKSGVINRLKDIQDELNALHKDFPDIVANADGTVPSVLPLESKNGHSLSLSRPVTTASAKAKANLRGPYKKRPGSKRGTLDLDLVARYVSDGPKSIPDISKAFGVSTSGVRKRLQDSPMFKVLVKGHGGGQHGVPDKWGTTGV